jgi:two-component system OmpR family response regulator
MTSEPSLPLTLLVIGGSERMMSVIADAFPPEETQVVRVADLASAPPAPIEFIDLCVVDMSASGQHGLEVVRQARGRWPVVGICALGCRDVVPVLSAGADEALASDASRDVMVAQVAAAFRRSRATSNLMRVAFGDVVYDREAHRVWCAGVEVSLTPRELRLFDILFVRAGSPVPLETIQSYVWNGDTDSPTSNALAVYVSYLRKKLAASRVVKLETMRGVGYRLSVTRSS